AIAVALAITEPPGVFAAVVFATSVLGSALVPAYICAVWRKKANTVGAISSMVVGTVASVVSEVTGSTDGSGFDPMVIGLACSTITMILGSLLTQRSHPVPENVRQAVAETSRVAPVPARMVAGEDTALATQRPGKEARRDS